MPPANLYRAMAVFQGKSGLAEDRFVNTWHFRDDLGTRTFDAVADSIRDRVEQFFTGTYAGSALTFFMPAGLLETEAQVRVYRLSDPEPRPPEIRTFDVVYGSASPLPTEVAFCVSYRNIHNTARKRGRTFLGPFNINAMANDGLTARPSAPLIATATQAARDMVNDSYAADVSLRIYSPTANQEYTIDYVWADDAFDTIRARGIAPTARVTLERTAG